MKVRYEEMLPQHQLFFGTPSLVWDEAIPLGNGLLGSLVWGDGHPLRISLDRTDLWDLRPVPDFHSGEYSYKLMREWVEAGRIEDLQRVYENPYMYPGPTKIPAGRILLTFNQMQVFKNMSLPVDDPIVNVEFSDGTKARVMVHACEPVGMITTNKPEAVVSAKLIVPPFHPSMSSQETTESALGDIGTAELSQLGYPEPQIISGDNYSAFLQEGWGGFKFAVWLAWKKNTVGWHGVWSIATSNDSTDPLGLARQHCEKTLQKSFEKMLVSHHNWWRGFWNQSSIHLPNHTIERQWYLDTYKFGAASRRDAPPIALQGPWTADRLRIPPWKGDYHHDLNTQMCYWPCYSANHLEEGRSFIDWLWKTKPLAEKWTRRFFDKPGLNIPGCADLNNAPIGGWQQYSHPCTTAAWLSHYFYLHWRYSMDREFLQYRAYPFLRDASIFIEAIAEKNIDGIRTLPLSSSPEIHSNNLEAWFKTITNYDLSLIRWLLGATAELAEELNLSDEAEHWRGILKEMPQLFLSEDDRRLLITKDTPLHESHRHLSHLMAIYPLGLIHWENGAGEQQTMRSVISEFEQLGTDNWWGFTYAWMVSIIARAHDGVRVERALEIFSTAFCLRNSFHANGDYMKLGFSKNTDRVFTAEGNFGAAAGVQEMLLQSHAGIVQIFSAIPETWQDVSFKTLRAEGAFLVSAKRVGGKTQSVSIVAERGGQLRLADPFSGQTPDIRLKGAKRVTSQKDEFVFECEKNGCIELMR